MRSSWSSQAISSDSHSRSSSTLKLSGLSAVGASVNHSNSPSASGLMNSTSQLLNLSGSSPSQKASSVPSLPPLDLAAKSSNTPSKTTKAFDFSVTALHSSSTQNDDEFKPEDFFNTSSAASFPALTDKPDSAGSQTGTAPSAAVSSSSPVPTNDSLRQGALSPVATLALPSRPHPASMQSQILAMSISEPLPPMIQMNASSSYSISPSSDFASSLVSSPSMPYLPASAASSPTNTLSSSGSSAKKKSQRKPAWAYTAEDYSRITEDEVDDLLDFTENLDYEKYMEEIEIAETLRLLHKRIAQLEAEKKAREEADAAARALESERSGVSDADDLKFEVPTDPAYFHASSFMCRSPSNMELHRRSEDQGDMIDDGLSSAPAKPRRRQQSEDDVLLQKLKLHAANLSTQLLRNASLTMGRGTPGLIGNTLLSPFSNAAHATPTSQLLAEARALLQVSKSMRQIHSSASMSALVEKQAPTTPSSATPIQASDVVEAMAQAFASMSAAPSSTSSAGLPPPTPPRVNPASSPSALGLTSPSSPSFLPKILHHGRSLETPPTDGTVRVGSRISGRIITIHPRPNSSPQGTSTHLLSSSLSSPVKAGLLVDHADRAKSMKRSTPEPSQLPYLHRHPAI